MILKNEFGFTPEESVECDGTLVKPAEADAVEGEEGVAGADAAPADGDKPAAEGAKKEGEDKKPAEEKKQ